jgi:dTDP-glucose 4,6-dehydratase
MITKLLRDEKIPVYGEGLNEREWIHVDDVCNAVLKILNFYNGEKSEDLAFDPVDAYYHIHQIAGEKTYSNIDFLKKVVDIYESIIGDTKPDAYSYDDYFEFVEDRKGHDFRYDLCAETMKGIGWKVETPLDEGLKNTIQWYINYYSKIS